MPLPSEHLLDEFATAYVQIVAAAAGATIAVSRLDYGVDGTLKHIIRINENRYVESGFPVDFQLKGTTTAKLFKEHLVYDLKTRNYDLIVTRAVTATPYYLFLICFPAAPDAWLEHQTDSLNLGASAYWWTGKAAATRNSSTVRLKISLENRLTSAAIGIMLKESQSRFRP